MISAIPFPTAPAASTVIATSTGYFDLADPRPEAIVLGDIATALSRINRFTGHGAEAVSVARHSVNCYLEARARGLTDRVCRVALMHDATEAYVGDVSRPLKSMLPELREIESRVWYAVCLRFNLLLTAFGREIKEIDNLALITEARDLFPAHAVWPGFPAPGFSFEPGSHIATVLPDRDAFLCCAAEAGIA